MSILIERLPEKKWEDISIEDVNNAIKFDDSEIIRDRFCEEDAVGAQLGDFGIKYIPAAYDNYDGDRDAITTLFAGDYATAVCIPGCKEKETLDALRKVAWNFVARTSDRAYACNWEEEEVALKYIGYTRDAWLSRVCDLLIDMVLGL